MATERSENFWNPVELKTSSFSLSKEINNLNIDFGINGSLDDNLEKSIGCEIAVIGPMLDGFIRKIGKCFSNKLSRSNCTGIQSNAHLYFPWQVFARLVKLSRGYGATISTTRGKKSIKIVTVTFTSEETVRRVWHPRRLQGCNYLAKRKYKKIPGEDGNKQITVYNGIARVVVTQRTPITLVYNMKNQSCVSSFYIQRYDQNEISLDATLQAQLNGWKAKKKNGFF